MNATLATLSGRPAVKVRVQQGILHALFGRLSEAETAFRKAIVDDPTLVSPYVNLANVRLLSNDVDGALLAVKQGLARNTDSALLNLLAARIFSNRGDAANSAVFFAKVQKSAPDMAARFADLAPAAGDKPQRAADAGQAPIVIWGAD
jgi:tetratricopeptide (TPR) repeat protein